ncbi:MAG: putative RND superfamily exporter protein [Clostridium sp.]|jgi:predicted RND superfamily exporter protein
MIAYKNIDYFNYLKIIRKFRVLIILFFIVISSILFNKIDFTNFINSNNYWHQNFNINKNMNDFNHIVKISYINKNIDLQKLNLIEKNLEKNCNLKIKSILNQDIWKYTSDKDGSQFIENYKIKNENVNIDAFLKEHKEDLKVYYENKKFNVFIYSNKFIKNENIINAYKKEDIDISIDNALNTKKINIEKSDYIYFGMFLIFFSIIFSLLFRSVSAGLSVFAILSTNIIITFYLLTMLMPKTLIPVSTVFIIISISLLDYLYFYYRWYSTQYNKTGFEALEQSLNRNFIPAFWTSIVTLFSLGLLLFMDSNLIKIITLSIIIPITFAYVINITLVLSILTYFKIDNSSIFYYEYLTKFAEKVKYHNNKLLKAFTGITILTSIYLVGYFIINENKLYIDNKIENVIEYKYQFDVNKSNKINILELNKIENRLKNEIIEIEKIDSISQTAEIFFNNINKNEIVEKLNKNNILEPLFLMKMYEIYDSEIDKVNGTIYLENDLDRKDIIFSLNENYKELELTNYKAKVSESKFKEISILLTSSLFALFIISLFIGIVFNKFKMFLSIIFINSAPIVWFLALMTLLNIGINIEMFISIAIFLTLSSDSSIHFNYIYWRNRFDGIKKDDALKRMFYFSASPYMMSSMIILLGFLFLTFSNIHLFNLIGIYTSILLIFSLIFNFFVLPVFIHIIDEKEDYVDKCPLVYFRESTLDQ